MLLRFAGLTASGVSFWAVVSRLTLTTETEPAPRALKLGVPRVVIGASRQAASSRPAPRAVARENVRRMGSPRNAVHLEANRHLIDPRSCPLATRTLAFYLPSPVRPGSSVGRAAD